MLSFRPSFLPSSRIAFVCFLISAFSFLPAQQPAHFFLGESELDGIQIYDVIQDEAFNYWFATDQGFYRYDGYAFKAVDMDGAKGKSGFGFVKNKQGNIYAYNLNNQVMRVSENGCKVVYELLPDEQSTDLNLIVDGEGHLNIWARRLVVLDGNDRLFAKLDFPVSYLGFPFLTKKGAVISHMLGHSSLAVWEKGKIQVLPIEVEASALQEVMKFFRVGDQAYAIGVKTKNMYRFNEDTYQLLPLSSREMFDRQEFLRFYNENDQLWVAGTVSGVQLLTHPERQYSAELWFKGILISDVFRDHEGNLLLSTANQGVIVIPDMEQPDAKPVGEGRRAVSLEMNPSKGVLVGLDNGSLIQFAEKGFEVLSSAGTRPLNHVFAWDGVPFILFDDGKIKVLDKEGGKSEDVFVGSLKDAAKGSGNTIWLALNRGVVEMRWEGRRKFSFQKHPQLALRTNAVAWDSLNRNLYAATSDGLKIADSSGTVEEVVFQGESVLANDLLFHGGILYAATHSHGMLQFHNRKVSRQIIPEVNGSEMEILKFAIHDGRIFANTTRGLLVMDSTGRIIQQMNKASGFPTDKIFDFLPQDSMVWVCHSKGLQKLPAVQLTDKRVKPLLHLASVSVNDSILQNLHEFHSLGSEHYKIRFELVSPTLRHKENVRYHYRLQGYDDNWQTATYEDNQIVYNALSSGDYRFAAFAENKGILSEPITFEFSIATPFYLRWWFIVASNLLIIGTVFLTLYQRLERQRKQAMLLGELNMSKLKAIQTQMNPHFIFNALNSIQDLVLQGDIENSYIYINKFALLVRKTLDFSEKEFITTEEEINLLKIYLSLEKLRFQEDFEFEVHADDVDGFEIPPMLIQPFVENALVHGLLHKEGLRKLKITFMNQGQVVCVVEDNGVGREKAAEIKLRQRGTHISFAMDAIQRRFEILKERFGDEIGVEITDTNENGKASGTRVVIKLPSKPRY